MDTVIEVEGLRKEYGGSRQTNGGGRRPGPRRAPGGVFGFLGPNGAGKTTTIRCLLGLVRPTGGDAASSGRSPPGSTR
jgi:ABC-2 type transport system ATP-binding protein